MLNKTMVNHDLMKNSNTLTVFECIRDNGPISKKDIQKLTNLSWGSISNNTNTLMKRNLITDIKISDDSIGRNPCVYDVNPEENLLIGLDVNIIGITGIIVDLKSRTKFKIYELIKNLEQTSVIQQAKEVIYRLIAMVDDKSKIKGIGVAFPGHVDAEKGVSLFLHQFAGYKTINIKQLLETEFKIQVMIDHDPNCMALTEMLLGKAKNINNMIFIRLSLGIGMSIVIDRKIYRGFTGAAGELGHTIMDPNGYKCSCGNYGCLETCSSTDAILKMAREGLSLGLCTILKALLISNHELNLDTIIKAYNLGDDYIKNIIQKASGYMGIAITNMVNVFDPQLIVIGGEMAAYEDEIISKIRETVNQKVWKHSNVEIVASEFSNDAAAIGAASMLIHSVYAARMKELI